MSYQTLHEKALSKHMDTGRCDHTGANKGINLPNALPEALAQVFVPLALCINSGMHHFLISTELSCIFGDLSVLLPKIY